MCVGGRKCEGGGGVTNKLIHCDERGGQITGLRSEHHTIHVN